MWILPHGHPFEMTQIGWQENKPTANRYASFVKYVAGHGMSQLSGVMKLIKRHLL